MDPHQESPAEVYRRAFVQRRWDKEEEAKIRKERRERRWHQVARYCAFLIALFGFVLLADKYLPAVVHNEVAETGWQEREGYLGGRYRPRPLKSYMKTKNFVIQVPHEIHVDYPYYDAAKPTLRIMVSPIFRIPTDASVVLNSFTYSFAIPCIHRMFIPLTWMMFVSAMFTIIRRAYSMLNYSLCFLPILLLAFVLLKML